MPSLERAADRLRSLIDDADAIVVGIGSGMSSAAGFNHYNRGHDACRNGGLAAGIWL